MHPQARRLAVLFSPLFLIAACSSGQQHTTWLLNQRLQAQLAPDIAAGNVALQPMPDGAQVTLLGPSLFTNNAKTGEDQRPDLRASVIEGLLDPRLMQIQLADTSNLPDSQRNARIQDVSRYFVAYGLGSTLQPSDVPPQAAPPGPSGMAPTGLTITINLQCPSRPGWFFGYTDGKASPVCD
jgi:hypothetical protein